MVVSTVETDERVANGHQLKCNGTPPATEQHEISGDVEEMSAAALCINSGGFSDPEEAQGLSHFLEHMLFMGSEKYPGENDFSSHVSTCGGMMNAWTAQERSMFYFQVKTEHFFGCLDRFAQFFIAPLMRDSSVDRELEAVNSEFALALTNDNNRLQHFLASISAPGSPYRKFIFGNNKSLRDIPLEKGASVSCLLRQHWKTNFSADRMTLAIQSYSPLNELECRVREMFEAIPRRAFPAPDYSHFANSFETQEFNKFYKVCSVKGRDMLSIIWPLPSLLPYYQSNPNNVLADLLGDEGEGSVLAALRKMHWATELYADACLTSGMRNSTFCSMFEVHVHLTKLGHENIWQVCGVIFDYIKVVIHSVANETSTVESGSITPFSQRLPNTFQSYLEERQELWKSSFLYNDPAEALHNCELIAEMLQLVPHTKVLSARHLIEKIDIELYVRLLKQMTPERACIVHQSSEFGRNLESDQSWQTESWFNIRYKSEELSRSLLEAWSSSVESTTGLHLPFKNLFISTNFDLLPKEADMQEATSIYDYTVYRLRAIPLPERKFGDTAVYDPGTYHIRLFNTNPSDVNMCVTHFYMLGRTDLKTSVLCNLVAYVLNEPAFDYLRTKEMLSYYVALQPWVYRDGGSAHQAILLVCRSQATKFSVDHVSGRMNAFWYRIAPRVIAAMTKQSFRTCINALISEEQLKDTNMWSEYWRGYAEIFSRETIMFKRREKTVEILNAITQDDLLNFFLNEFLDPTRRRTLVVEVAAQTDSVKVLENPLQTVHVTHVEQVMVDREELEKQANSCAEVDVPAVMLTAGYDNQTAVINLSRTTTNFWEDDRHPWPTFDSTEVITNVCSFRQKLKFDSGRYV
ncbi:hypothetical protein PHET_00587 [Paragonimus heterotremus]|uniref:Nardilysin n=1 Tax=Paragonimus heterotremus TaxID=100268 RepID=A0A8J4SUY2_9TREM|nr:hypothetical protein PHET_00587 [Paragonimus heterotremus]